VQPVVASFPRRCTREDPELPSKRIMAKVLHRYWRLSRGLTMGAQAAVIDADERLLLIRHTYQTGWRFPGGGVERGEPVEAALARELEEEAGVLLTGKAELFGLYANFRIFPNDHIALFLVRSWHQPRVPQPNYEIAEHGFFRRDDLPADMNAATSRRIGEIFSGTPRDQMW
jgi:8-oxo-dGTP pyrophosphatase MutT (NUDIX family)